MKISDIRTRVVTKAMDGRHRNPRFAWREKQTLLVFVESDTEVLGVGEAWCGGGRPESLVAFIEQDVKPALLQQDVDAVEGLWAAALDRALVSTRRSQTWAAMSAIDIALWDLRGKQLGVPVWRLLGGQGRGPLPYASGGLYVEGQTCEAFAEEYAAYARAGYRGIKIKIGGAPLSVDVARVEALRKALGPDIRLMVDGLSVFDVPRAIALAKAIAPYGIYWFEQPVPIEDFEGAARVHALGGIPVAGNESEYGLQTFRRLIEAGAVHFVQYDLSIGGGFTYGRKLAALAEAFSLPVTLHHSASIVLMAANLHLAAAVQNCDSIEFHVLHQLLFERAPAGFLELVDGRFKAPESPGLGVDLDDLGRGTGEIRLPPHKR
jgi:L-alanine-DL-glutamate epimerase-like enolase superfamily enzyme